MSRPRKAFCLRPDLEHLARQDCYHPGGDPCQCFPCRARRELERRECEIEDREAARRKGEL